MIIFFFSFKNDDPTSLLHRTYVYITGYELKKSTGIATYWKNNVAMPLTDRAENSPATSIMEVGTGAQHKSTHR